MRFEIPASSASGRPDARLRRTPFGHRLHIARLADCPQGLSYDFFRFLYAPHPGYRQSADAQKLNNDADPVHRGRRPLQRSRLILLRFFELEQ